MRQVVVAFALIVITLRAEAAVTGNVVGLDGAAIANASVAVMDPPLPGYLNNLRVRAPIATTTTDTKGAFSLNVPGKGVIDVWVTKDGYAPANVLTAIDDAPGKIVLTKASSIVMHLDTIEGTPIADADVIAIAPSGGVVTAKTAADGTWRMADPSMWAAMLVIRKAGFESNSVAPNEVKTSSFKLLRSELAVKGRVVGAHDEGVGGATVDLEGITTTSAPDGSFTLEGAPRLWPFVSARTATEIGFGQGSKQPIVIRLAPLMHLRGVVRDAEKAPLRGITIAASRAYAITDANGAFDLEVPRGRQGVAVLTPVYAVVSDPTGITEDAPHEITAAKRIAVDGKVVHEDGSPLPFAQINGSASAGMMSSSAGTFRVYIDPKTTTLSASKRELPTARASIDKQQVRIVVGTPITIAGTVRDRAGKPIGNASVSVGGAFSISTKADGTWSALASRGPAAIIVRANGYGNLEKQIDVKAGMPSVDVVMTRQVSVVGHVIDAEGKPAQGIKVVIGKRWDISDEKGEFEFNFLDEGETTIGFGPYASQQQKVVLPDPNVVLKLTPTRKFHGKVIDTATHAPVKRFLLQFGNESKLVESPEGRFDIDIPRKAPLSVAAEGYLTRTDVSVTESDDEDYAILLTKGRTVRGRVVDEHGKAIASVSVTTDYDSPPAHPITTDAQGRYEIVAVGPHVGFEKHGYASITFVPDGDDDPHTLDVTLKRGITITGTVVDKAGNVVSGADVMASSAATFGGPWPARTDEGGNFTIEDLPSARYDFVAHAEEESARGAVRDVDIEKTANVKIVVEKAETGSITGHVNGAIADAPVWVNVIASPEESKHVQADSGGNFRVPNAPAGRVEVEAFSFNGQQRAESRRVVVDVKPGTESRVDLSLVQQVSVHGIVHWNNAEFPGMVVHFDHAFAVTNNDGGYEMKLAPGEYDVTVDFQEDMQLPFSQHVIVSGDAEVNLTINSARLPVQVVDADTKKPLAQAGVGVLARDTKQTELAFGTSENGKVDLPVAPGRPITLHVWHGDYAPVYMDVTPDAKPAPMTLELQHAAGTVVRVVDARNGSPIFGSIVVRDMSGHWAATANKWDSTTQSVTIPLRPGKYQFSASAENFGSATIVADVPASEVRIPLPRGGRLLLRSTNEMKATARLIQPNGEPYVHCWCNGMADVPIEGRSTLVDFVAPGKYTLEVTPANGKPRRFPVTVVEGQTVSVSID